MTLPATIDAAAFTREWADWHAAHELRRADPHGFLAVTGLFWLSEEPTAVPGVPGLWSTGAEGPAVEFAHDEELIVDGVAVGGTHRFGPIAERDGVTVGFSGGVVEVATRGGRGILRPRRSDFAFLRAYAGTPVYPADPGWRVPARFVRFIAPRSIEVGAAVDGLSHVYDSPGYAEFAKVKLGGFQVGKAKGSRDSSREPFLVVCESHGCGDTGVCRLEIERDQSSDQERGHGQEQNGGSDEQQCSFRPRRSLGEAVCNRGQEDEGNYDRPGSEESKQIDRRADA